MNKNKLHTIIAGTSGIIIVILLIFLILRTNKLQHNIQMITGEDLVDITPIEKSFDLNLFQASLIKNIEKNKQSIVGIYEQKRITILNENQDNDIDNKQDTSIETIKTLQGNGIIISEDGFILTNKHVVGDSRSKYTIAIGDKEFNTDKIRYDEGLDLAVIKIKVTKSLIPVKIIDILNKPNIGQIVFAFKQDPENNETITKMGIINSQNQKFKVNNNGEDTKNNIYIGLLQTSTAIEPGFSGGPLTDINGDVIGINTAIDNIEYGASYALPLTQEFINQTIYSIKESSKIIRPYLGINYTQDDNGIRVTQVAKDSPADVAGIEIDDIIYGINNNNINYNDFLYQLYTYKPKKNIILNTHKKK